ncbi:chromosome partitioning protein ParB [Maritimibacter sp. 55A14]|uniref:ParB/RepB/Spo0J family partition protein n=1 Tax=Maritimibacter sp. 55A14 TaxID=2174844 RepID=UPI000D612A93|nr:ParB N-terminal domain-containing protein [Maritimibacter sp. 55A14]PWE29992.1 chromosome partitioning protein ParB [Maritimibacter sp. 55A14]
MADFRKVPTHLVEMPGDRLRGVDENHAKAIALDVEKHGLINPITVRGPFGAKGGTYSLLAGAHRLRAVQMLGLEEVETMVVHVNGGWSSLLIEIGENLFRNDLSKLDRAMFVSKYREAWEAKYGKVGRGRNSANIAEFLDQAGLVSFSDHVATRMGLSKRSIEAAQEIAQKLHPELRRALSGTPEADNQAVLQRFCKASSDAQCDAARRIRSGAKAKDELRNVGVVPDQNGSAALERLTAAWGRLSKKDRREFVRDHRAELAAFIAEAGADE